MPLISLPLNPANSFTIAVTSIFTDKFPGFDMNDNFAAICRATLPNLLKLTFVQKFSGRKAFRSYFLFRMYFVQFADFTKLSQRRTSTYEA